MYNTVCIAYIFSLVFSFQWSIALNSSIMHAYYVVFEMGNNFHATTPPQKKKKKNLYHRSFYLLLPLVFTVTDLSSISNIQALRRFKLAKFYRSWLSTPRLRSKSTHLLLLFV